MIVVGIGARKGVTPEEIEAIIDAVLEQQKFSREHLTLIASLNRDDLAPTISEVASKLKKPTTLISADRLKAEADRCKTHSGMSMEQYGVPSVAEAAALAALSENAILIAPRIKHPTVTAALAIEIVSYNILGGTILRGPIR